ncbi:RNA polymerase sigma factor [Xylanimonas ulmi]|uniref:RNA polymerase sigma-70 factor (ECF subfamily) n=1 Tax=Xylanimonas ulmi TaxID=228973 RepID=A0A4V2EXS8_9MICO|nr:sigma-70 family RNA polymerase sigma factor [Xylanibacterium ulmi]RZS60540.1 RNA polymerase sigma-70 factor (ECF subfamily) [Xylanibacterium ulmi]
MDTPAPSDADLLAQVAAGDERALRELVERHWAWLALRLRRRTSDEELAASALQDTFVAVWRSAGRYRGDGDVGAWLWGIAIRRLVSRLRVRGGPPPVSDAIAAALAPAVLSAEDELLLAVEHGDVGAALRGLSPELRQAIQATVVDGLTTREAARLLGIPAGTVKSRVRLAKVRMRAQLLAGAAADRATEGWT